jgi:hypothetical protein
MTSDQLKFTSVGPMPVAMVRAVWRGICSSAGRVLNTSLEL